MSKYEKGFNSKTFGLCWTAVWLATAIAILAVGRLRRLVGRMKNCFSLIVLACALAAVDSALLCFGDGSSTNSQLSFGGSILVGIALSLLVEQWCDAAESIGAYHIEFVGILRSFPYAYKMLAFLQMPLLASQVGKSVKDIQHGQQTMHMLMSAFLITASAMLIAYALMWYLYVNYLRKKQDTSGLIFATTVLSMVQVYVLVFSYYSIKLHEATVEAASTGAKRHAVGQTAHAWFSYMIYWSVIAQFPVTVARAGTGDPLLREQDINGRAANHAASDAQKEQNHGNSTNACQATSSSPYAAAECSQPEEYSQPQQDPYATWEPDAAGTEWGSNDEGEVREAAVGA